MISGVADIVARKVALLETMIREFTSTAANLAREVAIEEERTRIKDPANVAYSTLAKAVAVRRANLLMSAADAETRLRRPAASSTKREQEHQPCGRC